MKIRINQFFSIEVPNLYVVGSPLIIIMILAYIFNLPDRLFDEVINKLSHDTRYVLVQSKTDSENYDKAGVLGDFWSCIKDFRSIYSRRVKGRGDGIQEWVKIQTMIQPDKIKFKYKFWFRVSEGEVSSFDVEKYDINNNYLGGSDIYAINCDLDLLNKSY